VCPYPEFVGVEQEMEDLQAGVGDVEAGAALGHFECEVEFALGEAE
jgi:hypothetical protein